MSIEFENENFGSSAIPQSSAGLQELPKTGIVGWLTRKHIVKSEKQAMILVIAFCVVCFLLMTYLIAHYGFGFEFKTAEQIQEEQQADKDIRERLKKVHEQARPTQ